MPKITLNIDNYTNRVIKINEEIWGRSIHDAQMGSRTAFIVDIMTGWSGFLTTTVLYHPSWKFPLWVREQTNPSSQGYIPAGFSWGGGCTFNQRYRSFTMMGLRNSDEEPVVGLDGSIMPRRDTSDYLKDGSMSNSPHTIAFWLFYEGKLLAFGEDGKINQTLEKGYLPIVNTNWDLKDFLVANKAFVNKFNQFDICFNRTNLLNKTKEKKKVSLFVVVTPWGPDEFHPIFEIKYDKNINSFIVNGNTGVILNKTPDSYTCQNYKDGDVCVDAFDGLLSLKEKSLCEVGYCSSAAAFELELQAGQSQNFDIKIPVKRINLSESNIKVINQASFDSNLQEVQKDWDSFLNQGLKIKTPDRLVNETYKSAVISLNLLKDGEYTTPGPLSYHLFWIRDAVHQLKALEMLGFSKDVEQILEQFKTKQNEEGYFQNTKTDNKDEVFTMAEYDSNGQAIWAFTEHYRMSKDKEWLKSYYPYIKKGAEFISKLRRITLTKENKDTLHYGLMPRSWSAEHIGPYDHMYYDDFWGLCGLKESAFAAEELGFKEDAIKFKGEYEDFSKYVWSSIEKSKLLRNLKCFAASPYQDVSATIVGNIACFWPCKITEANNKHLIEVLSVLYSDYMPNGCWFNRHIWGAYGPILTWPIANCFVHLRERQKALRIFDWTIKNGQSATHAWPEGVSPQTFCGSEGDGYEGWGIAEFIMLLRNMLVLEKEDYLWIAPCIPSDWLKAGSKIELENVNTTFGKFDIKIYSEKKENKITIKIKAFMESPSKGYIIFLDLPDSGIIKKVSVDGKSYNNFNGNQIILSSSSKCIEVKF